MSEVVTEENKIDELLTRSVEEVLPTKDELKEVLTSGKKIRLYMGIDPTSPTIHLGNAILLWKMRKFQELGHEVIFLVGSFTGMIGDPSDKESVRQMLTKKQVEENFETYKEQASKILDFEKIELRYNDEWWGDMKLPDFFEILSKVTLNEIQKRDLFKRRLGEGKEVWMHETMYPVLQGYDSVAMDIDLELGGTDQTFNMLMGRKLQKVFNEKEKFVLTIPLIPGTDGRKMSKSYGNVINLTDKPEDMYGKLMSVSDDMITPYFEHVTQIPTTEVEEIKKSIQSGNNPMKLKKKLAHEVVKLYHGEEEAQKAKNEFEKVVQEGGIPETIKEVKIEEEELRLLDLIVAIFEDIESNSEAKRLIKQGGVAVKEQKITDPSTEIIIEDGMIIRAGKRNYVKIVFEE